MDDLCITQSKNTPMLRSLFFILFFIFPFYTGYSQNMNTPQETVIRLFTATDEQEWDAVEKAFAEKVKLDYSSMTGSPAEVLSATQIVKNWQSILPGFTHTHHQLGNFQSKIANNKAIISCYGTASHYLSSEEENVWTVIGSYDFSLEKQAESWKITAMTFNFKFQEGNTSLPQKAISNVKSSTYMKKVQFKSEGATLVGNLYLPTNYEADKRYPAIIVSGSWTTVKEQMAGTYAQKFADEGFIALAFDFRNFGESEGEPRFYENPSAKKEDIKNAVSFLENLPEVDHENIGAFGVCAGAMYTVMAAAEDKRIQAVATAASWLHDEEAVKLFYGGIEGVNAKIKAAQEAKKAFSETGEVKYIPTISETDESAAMYGPYDYYLNPERGAIKAWSADKFAVMSWEDWLSTNPMPAAKQITVPVLMVHSDGAVLPHYTKKFFEEIFSSDKKLHWISTELESPFHQFNFYDQEAEVNESIQEASAWFKVKL